MAAGLLYFMKSLNWGYDTIPQSGLAGRSLIWPRGRAVGGSTVINGMMYMRGNSADYDRWREGGLPGWGYHDVLPFFRSFERNVSHENSQYHGHDGELWTERAKGENPLYAAWLEAARQAGFSDNDDFNGANQEGIGLYDFNIHQGQRVTAATAFLDPILHRSNLTVISSAEVDRLAFKGRSCAGVVMRDGRNLIARREVVLSAGAINTPLLLERSGVGDGARLKQSGIDPIVHRPQVGGNLQDHLGVYVQHSCTQAVTLYGLMRPDRALWSGIRALTTRSGPATSVPLEAGGFLRTDPDLPAPDVHVTFVPGLSLATTRLGQMQHGFLTNLYQLRPKSRGSVHLAADDHHSKPIIDPAYLSHEDDRQCLRAAVRLARRIVGQPALNAYCGEELAPGKNTATGEDLDRWIAENANTVFHPVGTCRMGSDAEAVVDGELRVKGVERLRIADASVMPSLISGNTSAPTMMIAERAASFLLQGHR